MVLGRTLFIGLFLYILVFLGAFLFIDVGSANSEELFYNNYCKYWLDNNNKGLVEKNEGPKLIKEADSVLQLDGWPKVFGDNNLENQQNSLSGIINYFYSLSLWLAILVAFVSIIFAGFAYMTSGQSPGKRKLAQDKMKSIFIGIIILLTSVITLNLINPDLSRLDFCYDEVENGCKVEIDMKEISVNIPNIGFLPRSDINNKYQKGIPYSSEDSVVGDYKNVTRVSSANCHSCNGINYSIDGNERAESLKQIQDYLDSLTGDADLNDADFRPLEICNANCDQNSLKGDEDSSRIVGLDRLKCSLDYNSEKSDRDGLGEYKSWAIVANSDDNAVLACVGACALIAYEKTGSLSCPEYNDDRKFPVVDEDILIEIANEECVYDEEDEGGGFSLGFIDIAKSLIDLVDGDDDSIDKDCVNNLKKDLRIEYEDADGEGLEKIREFVCRDNNLKCRNGELENKKDVNEWEDIEEDNYWYDGELENFKNGWIFWGSDDSPDKNALKIHDEDDKSRAKLRACITDNYLLEAQDLPKNILGHNAKVCLCKV